MRSDLMTIYNKFLHFSFDEKIETGKVAASRVFKYLDYAEVGSDNMVVFVVSLVVIFIGADTKVSKKETEAFNRIFDLNFTQDDLNHLVESYNSKEFVDEMDKLIDSMPEEVKMDVCVLGLVLLCSDSELTDRESAIFEKILD